MVIQLEKVQALLKKADNGYNSGLLFTTNCIIDGLKENCDEKGYSLDGEYQTIGRIGAKNERWN